MANELDDLLFVKRKRRAHNEPNLVAIIDMMTTVIFFLLLSATFVQYTKHTLPPSKTSAITDPVAPPPLAPKLLVGPGDGGLTALLVWGGTEPGMERTAFAEEELETKAADIARVFHERHPEERSLQVGLATGLPYKNLISLMDGARASFPDIVLISGEEAEARLSAAPEVSQ